MIPKTRNIIIFASIAVVLIILSVFFFKKSPEEDSLISSSNNSVLPNGDIKSQNSLITQDFLAILLNVKSINLEDSIFSDPAFLSLRDSSIELIPDGTEGRPNPFAPIGFDIISVPVINSPSPSPSPETN